ncbi:MAG TPA: dephospho-CoA kinase [Chitinophagaceae bacterium]|nr:dephospho-CoA kinase [Chitinophagaceae bacterium]
MLKIGLTGGIGSGKSVVARVFEILGVPVYYADDAAKMLMNTDASLKASIIEHFGEEAYKQNLLDRKWLASVVFNDPAKLELLNSLTHPATIRDAENWMKRQKTPYIIKEAALLFESGSATHLDKVIGVSAPRSLRIKRVIARDGVTEQDVLKRISRQLDEDEKMKRCDYIIYNNEEEPVIPQVLLLHEKFLKEKV